MQSISFILLFGASLLAQAQNATSKWVTPTATTSDEGSWSVTTVGPTDLSSTATSNSTDVLNNTDCTPRRPGHGPTVTPDTPSAFYNFPAFKAAALNASTPRGWNRVFVNLAASSKAHNYLGYSELEAYDTKNCAARCDKWNGCKAINIYFERQPTLYLGKKCQNAPSMTAINCVYWGEKLRAQDVDNWGRNDWEFDITMAGSNGYNRGPPDETSLASGPASTRPLVFGAAGLSISRSVMLNTFWLAMMAWAWLGGPDILHLGLF